MTAIAVRQLAELVAAWDEARGLEGWPVAMSALRAVQNHIVGTGSWSAGPSTLLDVLGQTGNEVLHCRVLRWLLDPLSRHGIGAALLADLFVECGMAFEAADAVQVVVEQAREQTRADIVVTASAAGSIVIEAKIYAAEGDRQGERLEELWPEARRFVFLTIQGDRIPATADDPSRWLPMPWPWFARKVNQHLERVGTEGSNRQTAARHAAAEWASTVLQNFE